MLGIIIAIMLTMLTMLLYILIVNWKQLKKKWKAIIAAIMALLLGASVATVIILQFPDVPTGAIDKTEVLYVDDFDSTYTLWTEQGFSPYLHDSSTDYIYAISNGLIEAWFSFANFSGAGTPNAIQLYFETYQPPIGDEQITFSLKASGLSETSIGTITPTSGAWN